MTPAARQAFTRRAAAHRAAHYGERVIHDGINYDLGAVAVGYGTIENQEGGQSATEVLTWRMDRQHRACPARLSKIIARGSTWIIREVRDEPRQAEWEVKATKS